MKSDHGLEFLLDLAKTTELRSGNFIELEDGRLIEIIAASEKLMKASSSDQLLIMKKYPTEINRFYNDNKDNIT